VPHAPTAPRSFASAVRPTGTAGIQRWRDAVSTLTNLQAEYASWLEALPDNQRDGTTAEALQAIVELDLSALQTIEPPRGFGRD